MKAGRLRLAQVMGGRIVRYPRRAQGVIALAIAAIALAIMASPASAATTRADFVAQADPICQNGQAQEAVAIQPFAQALKRDKKHHNRKTRRRVGRAFLAYLIQYTNIERAVNAQLATLPVAPDDISLIQVWLRARGELLDLESRFLLGTSSQGKGLKGLGHFLNDFFTLIGKEYEVADMVRDFGFTYCTAPPPETQVIV
jgi:hypothetical protein